MEEMAPFQQQGSVLSIGLAPQCLHSGFAVPEWRQTGADSR